MEDNDPWGFGGSSKKDKKKLKKSTIRYSDDFSLEPEPVPDLAEPRWPPGAEEVMTGEGFPLPSRDQGSEIATITVGNATGGETRTFHIHKNLIIRASDYFSAALGKHFAEGETNHIELDWACSTAFEVLYQYVYSGRVFLPIFYTNAMSDDVLWLRTFKLAHGIEVNSLLKIAYYRIRELMNSKSGHVPSGLFIHELYDNEAPLDGLRSFVVAHSAYSIHQGRAGSWLEWAHTIGENTEFGQAVAIQLVKLHMDEYEGSKDHPTKDEKYDEHNFFALREDLVSTNGEDSKTVVIEASGEPVAE